MKKRSDLTENVEHIFDEFFETGQGEGKVHTLHLQQAPSQTDKADIKAALSGISGVEGVHVGDDSSEVHVLCTGPAEPLVEALRNAGYEVTAAH